jgi:putative intracellular protease/amidase
VVLVVEVLVVVVAGRVLLVVTPGTAVVEVVVVLVVVEVLLVVVVLVVVVGKPVMRNAGGWTVTATMTSDLCTRSPVVDSSWCAKASTADGDHWVASYQMEDGRET